MSLSVNERGNLRKPVKKISVTWQVINHKSSKMGKNN
jgi:hypothetical protein